MTFLRGSTSLAGSIVMGPRVGAWIVLVAYQMSRGLVEGGCLLSRPDSRGEERAHEMAWSCCWMPSLFGGAAEYRVLLFFNGEERFPPSSSVADFDLDWSPFDALVWCRECASEVEEVSCGRICEHEPE